MARIASRRGHRTRTGYRGILISTNTGEPLLPMAQVHQVESFQEFYWQFNVVTQPIASSLCVYEVDTASVDVATAVGSVLQRLAARTSAHHHASPASGSFGHAHLR